MTTIIPVLSGGKRWSGLQYSSHAPQATGDCRGLLGRDWSDAFLDWWHGRVPTSGTTLARAEEDLMNLARSLSQHADSTFKAPDVAMTVMVDLLKYQNPLPERFNAYSRASICTMPQIQFLAAFNADGTWRYSSLEQIPSYSNADRPYFTHHRDNLDKRLLIGGPVQSRTTGRPAIVLSKRISNEAGDFLGVMVGTIDCEFFSEFYSGFSVGTDGGISLILRDGTMLARRPVRTFPLKVAETSLIQKRLSESSVGSEVIKSPFDGLRK